MRRESARAHHPATVEPFAASPANVSRHFLSWDRPLLPQAVRLLAGNWRGNGPLDLSELLVVVPTRQSGRRLREALAEFAAVRHAAVFPPRVMLPEAIVSPEATTGVATRLEALLAWADVFRTAELAEFREVFPVDPPARNFPWAFRLAAEFLRLQRTLAEAGLRLQDVIERVKDNFPEFERWRQIGTLEELHDKRLARAGLRAAPRARIAGATEPVLPPGVQRIVLLAVPDPQPLALQAFAALSRQVPVEIVVFAPAAEADVFDEWGRPRPEAWSTRVLALPDFDRHVHVCADPAVQAAKIAALAQQYREPEGILGVGVADPEVLPLLEGALEQVQQPAFNPEGRPRRGDRFFQLLQACARLAREDSFASVEALARCPDFLACLRAKLGPEFSAARFLRELDQLHARNLPPTLAEARRHAERGGTTQAAQFSVSSAQSEPLATVNHPGVREAVPGSASPQDGPPPVRVRFASVAPALRIVAELRTVLITGSFPANAVATLATIFDGTRFDSARAEDERMTAMIETWNGVLREITGAASRFEDLSIDDWWDVALRVYSETIRYDEKAAGAMELQGWLELLWEDAPHLVVAGFNDGRVPDAIVGDPFLPESLRAQLGLKTNAARFARDAYLLQAIAAWRMAPAASQRDADASPGGSDLEPGAEGGDSVRLDLLLGKTSVTGDPLRPSRLLLRCRDEDLPERIVRLFGPAEAARSAPPWRRAWQLTPLRAATTAAGGRSVAVPERVAVTSLRAWLACPFRFYLSRVLRMEPVDPAKTELDVFDFGTLCHGALEAMGLEPALRNETDPAKVREFLLARLELEAARRFGEQLTLPLVVQLESARQRLSRAAEVQAQSRAEGWVIEHVERPFAIHVGGLTVTGKIDRVDRHERTGELRVLDYKTSDRPVNPEQAHLRGLRRGESPVEFARFVHNAKDCVWSDLQLPLYLRAIAGDPALRAAGVETAATGDGPIVTCGYFNLPKAVGETGIQPWLAYTRELDQSAWRCAEGVAAAIRAGEFWPPNETIRAEQDDFAALFHHGVSDSVTWEAGR